MLQTRLDALQSRIDYRFKNIDFLNHALTHSSSNQDISNERMEFLGDRVLGMVISEYLYQHFNEPEGVLAKRFNFLVSRTSCANIAKNIQLGECLIISHSEATSGGRQKETLLGNTTEALIAAIYLDSDFNGVKKVILSLWDNLFEQSSPQTDAKSALQEWSQSRNLGLPHYELTARTGPDHNPVFEMKVSVLNHGHACATGKTRRIAEHQAASLLYDILKEK
jgi:ribonuclease-3